jgi:hypothetical protein
VCPAAYSRFVAIEAADKRHRCSRTFKC